MAGKLVFITGGARSGKSTFAESLAHAHPGPVTYIPTATVSDAEMARRVALHRERRPADWLTVECRRTLAETLTAAAVPGGCLLVDCLTIYLVRLLPPDLPDTGAVPSTVLAAVEERVDVELQALGEALIHVCETCHSDVILVSNEVGSGLVPAYPSGRLFRDVVGRANRHLAAAAAHVYLVVAGCPVDLKALPSVPLPWGSRP